jgi:hypothetical protein
MKPKVIPQDGNPWFFRVTSSKSSSIEYAVDLADGNGTCSCKAWEFARYKSDKTGVPCDGCKHIDAAQRYVYEQEYQRMLRHVNWWLTTPIATAVKALITLQEKHCVAPKN